MKHACLAKLGRGYVADSWLGFVPSLCTLVLCLAHLGEAAQGKHQYTVTNAQSSW